MVSKLFLALNLLITSTLYGCVPGAAFQIPLSTTEKEDLGKRKATNYLYSVL